MKVYTNVLLATLVFSSLILYSNVLSAATALLVETQVDKYQLTLLNEQKNCQLSVKSAQEDSKIDLAMQSPCYFFPNNEKNGVQMYAYDDKGVAQIMLVGGTAVELSAEERKLKKLPISSYCTQEMQAVTLEHAKIKLSEKTQAFACGEDRLDDIVYKQVLQQERVDIKKLLTKKNENSSFFGLLKKKIQGIFE